MFGTGAEIATMKNQQVFKSFTALSFDGTGVTGTKVPAPAAPEPGLTAQAGLPEATTADVREMLRQRSTVPYVLSTPHRHWGINE